MKRIYHILTLMTMVTILSGCNYNSFDTVLYSEPEIPLANITISQLKSLYQGIPTDITDTEIIISGYIITSDKSNNFYRTFIIDDGTAAAEIYAGLYDMHNNYKQGQRVTVLAKGLRMTVNDEMLQLGIRSHNSNYAIDYIGHAELLKQHVLRHNESTIITPTTLSIKNLTEEMTGRLVTIRDITVAYAADTTWALPDSISPTSSPLSANIKFKTPMNDSIYVFTSGYANFAGEKVPKQEVNITGILLHNEINGKPNYQLKLRDLDDVETNN